MFTAESIIMSRGVNRRARVVLRAAGSSKQQLNISDNSDTAASSSETDDEVVFTGAHHYNNSWNTTVGNSQELKKKNCIRNKLKKEIFGQTFENDEVSHETPLHPKLVSKHKRLPTCSSQEHKIHPDSMSELSSCISWDPPGDNEVDYHLVGINNRGSTEMLNTVPLDEHYSEEQVSLTHSTKKIKHSPLHNTRSSSKSTNIPINSSFHPGSVLGEQERMLLSTTYSMSSALKTTTTPLLTSNLRKGGRKPSMDTYFDFDAEQQLERCCADKQLQVMIVTWNMQEQKLLPDSLDDLLLPLSHEVAADMFVIGTQESTHSKQEWEILLQQTLGPSYVLIQCTSLGILYLTLYLRRELIWFCSTVCSSTFATRPGTIIKTKGGVGISFTLFGSSFLFITSHFTANGLNVQDRNSDMQRIASNLIFSLDSGNIKLSTFDYVFWLGDLNYRVEMDREQADQCVANMDWKTLLLKDQLTREMLQGNVFQEFSEQPITFPPSYKFDPSCDRYDSSEKKRVPSWTDRILFKSLKGCGITGCDYNICRELRMSDHRPVYAVFRVQLEPSRCVEGIPEKIATFDRDTYIKAQTRRQQLAQGLAFQRSRTDEPDGYALPPSAKHVTSSSVCMIL